MKVVNVDVYSGYGEMDVMGMEVMEVERLFDGVLEVRMDNLKRLMMDSLEDYEEGDWSESIEENVMGEWREFYSNWVEVNDDVYSVSKGEENFNMLVSENSIWFERLLSGYEKWSDKVWDEWLELCDG